MVDEDHSIPREPIPDGGSTTDLQGLADEDSLRSYAKKDLNQRRQVKWVAVIMGGFVVVFMAGVLVCVLHKMTIMGPDTVHPATAIAAIVGPIVSLTTVTAALFVGAFRRFEEKDLDATANVAANAANAGTRALATSSA